MEKLNEHTAVLGKVEDFAAKLEQLDGTKKNGSSDVLSRKNDIQQNWKSFSELREETDLRLRAAYSQLQVWCTSCNVPVDKLLLSLRCIHCSANNWNSLWHEVEDSQLVQAWERGGSLDTSFDC